MTIKVKFFGSVKDTLGLSQLDIDASDADTVADVWRLATDDQPVMKNIFCSVNLEHRELDFTVTDGDEVAFFPPVTGG